MKGKSNSVAKASLWYTIGNYCLKGIGFITVPIFSRLMSTTDFGIYNTFIAYEGILYLFIELALHESLKSAKYKFENQIDSYASSVSLIPMLIFTLCEVLAVLFFKQLSELLRLDAISIVILIWYSFCSGFVIFYRYRIALDYDYSEYIKLSAFNAIANVVISIFLMLTLYADSRYMGRVLGGTLAYSFVTVYIIIRLFRKSKPKVNIQYWKYGLKIGIPIIPHGLAQVLLLQFDRIMINSFVGSGAAGLYSFAYTIYSLIQITATSLETAFAPWVFEQLHDGDNEKNVQRIGTCFMLFIAGVVTVTMLISPELIDILGGVKYRESFFSTLPVLLGGFFAMAYCIPAVIEYYYEKTVYTSIGTAIAAVMNISLNALLIPRYGYIAAAYTTLFSYVVYFVLHTIISRKMCGFYIIKPYVMLFALVIMAVAFMVSMLYAQQLLVRIGGALILVGIGVTVMISVFGKDESIRFIQKILKRK